MKLRPYALLGATVLNETARRLTAAAEDWRSAWGLDMLDIHVECTRAWQAEFLQSPLQWQRCCTEQEKSVWVAWQPEFFRYIQRQLFPPDQRHMAQPKRMLSLASDGAEKALLALSDHIAGVAALGDPSRHNSEAPPVAVFQHGSGAVCARIQVGEQSAMCLFNRECVGAVSPRTMPHAAALPTMDIRKALSGIAVTLPIEIGQVDVEVGALMTLALGDVIRLSTSVDQPLTVYGPERKALFDGYLGVMDKSVALEVVRRGK